MNRTPVSKQVATELLCKPGMRMTNPERKHLMRCRETDVTPKRFDPLGIEHRLEYRLCQRSWKQLCRWMQRAVTRRSDTQAKFQMVLRRQEKLGAKTDAPSSAEITELLHLNQVRAALDAKARVLDIFIEAVSEEVARREKLWASVKKAGAPAFAKRLASLAAAA